MTAFVAASPSRVNRLALINQGHGTADPGIKMYGKDRSFFVVQIWPIVICRYYKSRQLEGYDFIRVYLKTCDDPLVLKRDCAVVMIQFYYFVFFNTTLLKLVKLFQACGSIECPCAHIDPQPAPRVKFYKH